MIESTFEVMKIQYSLNHRDFEGEHALKAKQSSKWRSESRLLLINLLPLMLNCAHPKDFNLIKLCFSSFSQSHCLVNLIKQTKQFATKNICFGQHCTVYQCYLSC